MKQFFLALLLTIAVFFVLFHVSYSNALTDSYLLDLDGLTWGNGKNTLTAKVTNLPLEEPDLPEVQDLLLSLYDTENNAVFEQQLSIDWDMFGAGFLKAMQVDNDPELEIVFKRIGCDSEATPTDNRWQTCNFYLDMSSGKIEQKNFTTFASPKARELAKTRLVTVNPLNFFVIAIFSAPFVLLLMYGFLSVIKFLRNKRRNSSQDTTGNKP
jgi:hypothetical protein